LSAQLGFFLRAWPGFDGGPWRRSSSVKCGSCRGISRAERSTWLVACWIGAQHLGPELSARALPADRVRYVPSPWYVLPRELRYLGVSGEDTFLDLGCGKGRVVHQAARWPFRRVIGVEISPVLAEMARRGLAALRHQHRSRNVEIVVADAAEFRVPDDVTICYLYDPFHGQTLVAVLRSIIDSIDRHPRRVRIIYLDPQADLLLNTGRFRLLRERRGLLRDHRIKQVAIYESC
jgi:SAM-dependent methyltransferase